MRMKSTDIKSVDKAQELKSSFIISLELIKRLILRNIFVRYRQSLMGYLWAFIIPVVMVLFFGYITSTRVITVGATPFAYPVFALFNVIIWQYFAGILVGSTGSLSAAGALVTKINFPKETLVFSAVGQPLFELLIKLPLLIGAFLWYGVKPDLNVLFIPFLLLPLTLLAIGAGFILSIANLLFKDIESVAGIIASYGMFAAPIIYPPSHIYPFSLLNVLNPFSPYIIASQNLIATGETGNSLVLSLWIVISVLVFIVSWLFFRSSLPRVIERA